MKIYNFYATTLVLLVFSFSAVSQKVKVFAADLTNGKEKPVYEVKQKIQSLKNLHLK